MMSSPTLDELADVRAGDKGDTLILAVLPRTSEAFDPLIEQLTEEVVARHFQCTVAEVTRTVLPQVRALVFNLHGVLGGGVTGSTSLDGHGKTLSYYLLTLPLTLQTTTRHSTDL
jgi:hypothetical protein